MTGTSLLVNFTNGGVIDRASTVNLETLGNAQISTGVKKYGTGSISFDGSSKILTTSMRLPAIAENEDFTVEAWIYPTTVTADSTLYCIATPRVGSGNWYFGIYYGKLFCYDESISTFYGNGSITPNTWQHVAYTRQGTTHRLFLNGVNTDTKTSAAQAHPSKNLAIGAADSSKVTVSQPYYGYMDDFRITKGVARYTTGFTPPTNAMAGK